MRGKGECCQHRESGCSTVEVGQGNEHCHSLMPLWYERIYGCLHPGKMKTSEWKVYNHPSKWLLKEAWARSS